MVIDAPLQTRGSWLARLRQLTGTENDDAAIVQAVHYLEEREVTPEMLVREGSRFVIPAVPGHILTDEMVADALAELY